MDLKAESAGLNAARCAYPRDGADDEWAFFATLPSAGREDGEVATRAA